MSAPAASAAASLALRVFYAIVFVGFASLGLGLSWPELVQLATVVSHRYHFGDPPNPIALLGCLACLAGVTWMMVRFARARPASIAASAVILVGAALCLVRGLVDEPRGRTWAVADKQIVDAASALRESMAERLRSEGAVPADPKAWEAALKGEVKAPSPARLRSLAALPYEVEMVKAENAKPPELRPASFLVWVSPDGAAFDITPVGFSSRGEVEPLQDGAGETIVLKNVSSPDDSASAERPTVP